MDTPEFYINPIIPSIENAKDVIDLRYRDMRRAGLLEDEARGLADSNSKEHIDQQVQLLGDYNNVRYFGAIAIKSDKLLGYSENKDWTAEDLLRYCGNVSGFAIKALASCLEKEFISDVVGLHELVIDSTDVAESRIIIESLLDNAIEHADTREMFIATYRDRVAECALEERRFRLVSDSQWPWSKVKKELYIRPISAVEHNSIYEYEKHIT